MKLIIGVYDRELSHNLSILLSSKKIIPIEAESMEEISALLRLHPEAMLLCEEFSSEFYDSLNKDNIFPDTYLLFHPTLSSSDLMKLRNKGIRALIPYTENAYDIIDIIIKQLSTLASVVKQNDKNFIAPSKQGQKDVYIHLTGSSHWIHGELLGFNSYKVSIKISNPNFGYTLLETKESDSVLMHMQGLNIKVHADLVHNEKNIFIFRYRKMDKDNTQRLAYYINYCNNKLEHSKKELVN